ncbi:MAG: chemotaxis protein CheW [Deltaproteobacteria bacterium]|nr:chemotaxis protein CheW [Deltaproteobacteria bacterium]
MDDSRYKAIFLQETHERLSGIEKGLLELESNPQDPAAIDKLFRHYHSIKGMCSSMGYEAMKEFSHAQEDLLNRLRKTGEPATTQMISTLLSSLDALKDMTRRIEDGLPLEGIPLAPLIKKIKEFAAPEKITREETPARGTPSALPLAQGGQTEKETPPLISLPNIMKVPAGVFDELLRITGDLLTTLSSLKGVSARSMSIELKEKVHSLDNSIEELRSEILGARMLPFSTLVEGLPRIVRDISVKNAKEAELKVEGIEERLDRGVLESMADPLVHLVRNAVDHGIETPSIRRLAGKTAKGTITVGCEGKKEKVVIRVTDDGGGIDLNKLKEKAQEMGVAKENLERMDEKELLLLVCMPGLSLSLSVTDVSGRGVGMDIVRNAVKKSGGTLVVESSPERGTSVIMELPRSSSIARVLLVRAGQEVMGIPVAGIEKVVEVKKEDMAGLKYGGENIRVKRLGELMGMDSENGQDVLNVVILGDRGTGECGLAVEGVLGEMSAYMRPLAPPFSSVRGVTGFTVMGDGRPVFILDTAQLLSRTGGGISGQ